MIALVAHYWYGIVLSFGIGLITAWWTWGSARRMAPQELDLDEPIIWPTRTAAAPVQPPVPEPMDVHAPEPLIADPVEDDVAPPPAAEPAPPAMAFAPADDLPVEPLISVAQPAADIAELPADDDAANAPDDLMLIKGIGPELANVLNGMGIRRFDQIAGWMPEDIEQVDGRLGAFKGRILRDEWIGQARLLAKGDIDTFQQRYGHL